MEGWRINTVICLTNGHVCLTRALEIWISCSGMSRESFLFLVSLCIFVLNGANDFQCRIFTCIIVFWQVWYQCWGSKHCMKHTHTHTHCCLEAPELLLSFLQCYNTSLPPSVTCPSDDSAHHHLTSMYTELQSLTLLRQTESSLWKSISLLVFWHFLYWHFWSVVGWAGPRKRNVALNCGTVDRSICLM